MTLRFGSVCSGIEAASVAWSPLGWVPTFYSEIDPFPCWVLAQRHGASRPQFMPDPDQTSDLLERRKRKAAIKAVAPLAETGTTPNLGDMRAFKKWKDYAIDVLVGGTPCQSFSIAGLRAGLADPRGNLLLTFLAIAERYRPRWLVWENVPGVLSADGGRAFAALVNGMAQLGYGWAYRVLDTQYVRVGRFRRAIPQRRRRVFVVGYLGDWRRAAAVLFDGASLRGDPAPRRETSQNPAPTTSARTQGRGGPRTDFDLAGGLIAAFGGNNTSGPIEVAAALGAHGGSTGHIDFESETFVAGTLDASYGRLQGASGQDLNHGHSHLVPVAGALTAGDRGISPDQAAAAMIIPIAWSIMPQNSGKDYKARQVEVAQPLMAGGPVGGNQGGDFIQRDWAVRRLTLQECERLQGFNDDYTLITYRGKPAADGPRYKTLGNTMSVNVKTWLGERIAMVDAA